MQVRFQTAQHFLRGGEGAGRFWDHEGKALKRPFFRRLRRKSSALETNIPVDPSTASFHVRNDKHEEKKGVQTAVDDKDSAVVVDGIMQSPKNTVPSCDDPPIKRNQSTDNSIHHVRTTSTSHEFTIPRKPLSPPRSDLHNDTSVPSSVVTESKALYTRRPALSPFLSANEVSSIRERERPHSYGLQEMEGSQQPLASSAVSIISVTSMPETKTPFTDIEAVAAKSRGMYRKRARLLSAPEAPSRKSSMSTLVELDNNPVIAQTPELPSSPVQYTRRAPFSTDYGATRYNTLPGESFPVTSRELSELPVPLEQYVSPNRHRKEDRPPATGTGQPEADPPVERFPDDDLLPWFVRHEIARSQSGLPLTGVSENGAST